MEYIAFDAHKRYTQVSVETEDGQRRCTYTYSPWGVCQAGGTQSRTVLSSSPAGAASRAWRNVTPAVTARSQLRRAPSAWVFWQGGMWEKTILSWSSGRRAASRRLEKSSNRSARRSL